jgi:hypothetical protein
MSEYKNTTEGFAALRKHMIKRAGPIMLMSFTAGLVICYGTNNVNTSIYVWVIIIVLLSLVFVFALRRGINQQKENYYSYRLQINKDDLSRQQNGLSSITISFNDIIRITEGKLGDLHVKGRKATDTIAISPYIENYEQVKATLQGVQIIQKSENKNLLQKSPFIILPLVAVGAMIAVYISNNKIVVALSGSFLILMMGWGFYEIRTSPQIDARVRQSSWWLLIVLISILAIIYNKVFAV